MVKIEINPADLDGSCEALVAAATNYAENNEPEIDIENNGIGGYEYWGAKGYDEGTNYAVIDNDQEEIFSVDVTGCDEDFISDLFLGIDEEPMGHKEYEYRMKRSNDVSIKLFFMLTKPVIENSIATMTGKWIEK
jgi:hypothetical protein